MNVENSQEPVVNESGSEKKKNYLEELSTRLENDMANIAQGREKDEEIDPSYTREISLNVRIAIESIRRIESSSEINQAFGKVSYLLDEEKNKELVDMYLELAQTHDLLLQELENNVDEKKSKMLHEILEGMQGEFDVENPQNNHPIGMASVAHKLFLGIATLRDLNLSDNLIGIEGRASFLKERSNNLEIDEVQVEVYKMLLGIKKELKELS